MKKLILLLILASTAKSFGAVCTPPSGMGCDVPTLVVGTASLTDATKATVTWNTTLASDSMVILVDALNNTYATFYDGTMCTPVAGVCPHSVNISSLTVSATVKFIVASCTHATFGNIGTQCPDTSQDWSSDGPPTRSPGPVKSLKTIARPTGTLSWTTVPNAPSNAFQGQEFFINNRSVAGIGTFGADNTPPENVYYNLFHDLTIDTPSSGTVTCGFSNTNTAGQTYQAFGTISFADTCNVGAGDFTITPLEGNSNNWVATSTNNINNAPVVVSGPIFTAGQAGYYIPAWTGGDWLIYIKVGASVPVGQYTLHYHLQPLLSDGTGGPGAGSLAGQDKTVDVPINVVAVSALARHAPVSFPAWTFQPTFMVMASYWGTWVCSNTTDIRSGTGPYAMENNSGVYQNVGFTAANFTNASFPWVYDGTRHFFAIGDILFSTAHSNWAAGHTYTIGDLITVSGTTYILNAIGGATTPGATGVSGLSMPSFSTGAGTNTTDLTLQWMSVSTPDYWRQCALQIQDGYRNVILMNQGETFPEYTMFGTGMLEYFYRTGDAAPGDETGHTYTEIDQKFGIPPGLSAITSSNGVAPSCLTANDGAIGETGTSGISGYWTGGERMALCYSASIKAPFGSIPNSNNIFAIRPKALQLQFQDAYWMLKNDPNWINTLDSTAPYGGGQRTKRMVETGLAALDMFMNVPSSRLVGGASGAAVGFYESGQIAEALLHYYLATVYYSNTTAFPCPSGGYTVCVTPDERIPQALKTYADWAWTTQYDIEYDKNEVLADACPQVQCQHVARRLHSYSFRYDHWTLVDHTSSNVFNTESASNGEIGWLYSWLWARDSTMVPPSNGRITVSTYRDIALNMFQHGYDGRNCTAVVGTTPGLCTSWGIPDYFNGGHATGPNGYNALVSNAKQPQQTAYNTTSEGLHWATGDYTSDQSAMSLSTNPCWIVGNRNADGSCNTPSPIPNTRNGLFGSFAMAPVTINLSIASSRPGVASPTICRPGNIGNGRSSFCIQKNPTGTAPMNGLGTNQVPLNNGSWGTGGTISNTFAIFNFMTTQNAVCSIVAADAALGPVEPASTPSNTYPEFPGHTPSLVGGTPLPLWYHQITLTPLTPTTTYRFGLYCNNTPATDPVVACHTGVGNCFNYPYQVGGTTGKFTIGYSVDQAPTFTTTALPTGADLILWPGVLLKPGDNVK